ncbi:MAG: alpha/beta hydrolase [Brevinematales bacterium]|nr:alpha/beta hydrolase [Brevinematales bacterium]
MIDEGDSRKRRGWMMLGIGLAILGILIVPALIPVSPLEGILPVSKLADPDSRFTNIGGVTLHYKIMGKGEPVFFLLHGFGASLYSWKRVMPELAKLGTVVAYDRLGFGLTVRLLPGGWTNENPYSMPAQVKAAAGLLDALGVGKAVWVGHSAGGVVAVEAAAAYPDKVQALILEDSPLLGGVPKMAQFLYSIPSVDHFGPVFLRGIREWGMDVLLSAWHDTNKITGEDVELYLKPLSMSNWDIGLWEFTKAASQGDTKEKFKKITVPVLVITGDDDKIVPAGDTVSLTNLIPGARLAVIHECGHIPHEEQPVEFMDAVKGFIDKMKGE